MKFCLRRKPLHVLGGRQTHWNCPSCWRSTACPQGHGPLQESRWLPSVPVLSVRLSHLPGTPWLQGKGWFAIAPSNDHAEQSPWQCQRRWVFLWCWQPAAPNWSYVAGCLSSEDAQIFTHLMAGNFCTTDENIALCKFLRFIKRELSFLVRHSFRGLRHRTGIHSSSTGTFRFCLLFIPTLMR